MQALHGHRHAHAETPSTEGRLIRWARVYDPLVSLMTLGQTRALRALPVDLAGIKQGDHVLDVGCGTGAVTLAAARRAGHNGVVCGIDASPEMIEVARSKARRSGLRIQFRVEPVESLSFKDASFDVVLSSLMMHHLPGDLKHQALAEIRRVLRPGGRLVIVDIQPTTSRIHPWQPGWLLLRRHKHAPATSAHGQAATLADLLRDAGFVRIESGQTRYPWVGYARGWVQD